MSKKLQYLRKNAKRLERYSRRIKDGVWCGDRASLGSALADTAEAVEIARGLWAQIREQLASSAAPSPD